LRLAWVADDSLDLVILNSVVQSFPDVFYLAEVLTEAVRVTRAGGIIFVGDVRNMRFLDAYHASVQLHQAPAAWTRAQLQQRVQQRIREEEELLIDPAFFGALKHHLPAIEQVLAQRPDLTTFAARLTATDLAAWSAEEVKLQIVDVRNPSELEAGAVPGARSPTCAALWNPSFMAGLSATGGGWGCHQSSGSRPRLYLAIFSLI